VLNSDLWGKLADSSQPLPLGGKVLCAYELLIMAIADTDQIAYIHSTESQDELWLVTGEEFLGDLKSELMSGHFFDKYFAWSFQDTRKIVIQIKLEVSGSNTIENLCEVEVTYEI